MNRKAGLIVSGLVAIIASVYSLRNAEFEGYMVGDKEWHGPSIYASFPDMSGFLLMINVRHTVATNEFNLSLNIANPCQYDEEHLHDFTSGWGSHDQLDLSVSSGPERESTISTGKNEYGCRPEAKR